MRQNVERQKAERQKIERHKAKRHKIRLLDEVRSAVDVRRAAD